MGVCQSRTPPMPADAMPAFCIKGAKLSPEIITTVRDSWKRCMAGTEAHRRQKPKEYATTTAASSGSSKTTDGATKTSQEADQGQENGETLYSPIVFFYDTFYSRLFDVAPGVRPLFKESLKVQGRALVKMIDVAVRMVDNVEELTPALQDLARRHTRYGAMVPHYAVIGEVLLYTLGHCMGDEFTPAVKTAWLTVYSVMMSVMIPVAWQEEQRLGRAAKKGAFDCSGGKGSSAVQPAPASTASTHYTPKPSGGSSATIPPIGASKDAAVPSKDVAPAAGSSSSGTPTSSPAASSAGASCSVVSSSATASSDPTVPVTGSVTL